MTDVESAKATFAAAIERLLSERISNPEARLFDGWRELLSSTGIASFGFSLNPRELRDTYPDDEIVFSKTFCLYDAEYLQECCAPGPDCLAGKHSFPIGGIDGADEFVYLFENPQPGIAHLHRDDVFSAEDLDAVVEETASRPHISLPRFVELLLPPTNLAKFSASHDASKWLVVEDLGTTVRYEINLTQGWDVGERRFDSSSESEAFFFDLIRRGCAMTNLSLLDCPPHLRERIDDILSS